MLERCRRLCTAFECRRPLMAFERVRKRQLERCINLRLLTVTYGRAFWDRISYRIVSRYFVQYRIVSIVFPHGHIVPSLNLMRTLCMSGTHQYVDATADWEMESASWHWQRPFSITWGCYVPTLLIKLTSKFKWTGSDQVSDTDYVWFRKHRDFDLICLGYFQSYYWDLTKGLEFKTKTCRVY